MGILDCLRSEDWAVSPTEPVCELHSVAQHA